MPGQKINEVTQSIMKKIKRNTISWQYGGKAYSGTEIKSMETETHKFARTHNGKIKKIKKKS